MTWEEIKAIQLPETSFFKKVSSVFNRKFRRRFNIKGTIFVCPKDKNGGICYTCRNKED